MIERLTVGPIGENVYVLPLRPASAGGPAAGSGDCILVDPGDEAAKIKAFLDDRGLRPVLIACTHGHLDHSAAIPELREAYRAEGRELPLAVHRGDRAYFGAQGEETNRALFAAIRATGFFRSYWRSMPEPEVLLEDGELLPGSTWKVLHSPGHTAGSACFYEESLGVLVSGDTLFRDGVGRTDGPDSDESELHRSIMTRLFPLPNDTIVLPGHGEPTSVGREKGDAVE